MLIKKIMIIVFMLISFVAGMVFSFEMTLRNARAYSESTGVVVFEVYGQEWVYEE